VKWTWDGTDSGKALYSWINAAITMGLWLRIQCRCVDSSMGLIVRSLFPNDEYPCQSAGNGALAIAPRGLILLLNR
jgi:hypothetical protein